jgi:Fic family protein
MLLATPKITPKLRVELDELDDLRRRLGDQAGSAGPWIGSLRRQVRATSANSSISIEGFHVPERDRVAVVSGEQQPDPTDESRMALACYARAMHHVGVMAADPGFRWLDRVILDLHFDACSFQRDKSPGLWRTGPSGVTRPGGGELAYQGPDGKAAPRLMGAVVKWLERGDLNAHVVVRGAMAHLHVVSVHPFRDGNGRISRIVQSLVLAREGLLAPEFGSIEEYLGRHTPEYYAALQAASGGRYQPERDAGDWVAFCVGAHLEQARHRLAQMAQAGTRWSRLERMVGHRGWPDRLVIALEQSLFQGADRMSYSREAEVSAATASADFRRLLDAGLVAQEGRGRTTRYVASEAVRREVQEAVGKRA